MAVAKVVLVSVFLVACHPDVAWTKNRGPTGMVSIVNTFSDVNMDGSYSYGYMASDGSYRNETRQVNGEVSGEFGYTDSFGLIRKVTYGAHKKTNFKFESTSSIGGVKLVHPSLVEPMYPSPSPQLHNSIHSSAEKQKKNTVKSNVGEERQKSGNNDPNKEEKNSVKNISIQERKKSVKKMKGNNRKERKSRVKEEMKSSVNHFLDTENEKIRENIPSENERTSDTANGQKSEIYDSEARLVGGMRSLVGNKARNQVIRKQITLLDNGKTFMAVRKLRKPTKKSTNKVMKQKSLSPNPKFKKRQLTPNKRKARVLSKSKKAPRQNNFAEKYQRFLKNQRQMRQRKEKLEKGRGSSNRKSRKLGNGGRTIKVDRNFSIQIPLRSPMSVKPRSS